jgi:DNA repair exonuclease SbcCD ATPase subunit
METHMPMDEEEYSKVVDYMFQFKREQEELLQSVKARIREYCSVYETQIKKFHDINVSIKDSLENLKRFRSYERTLHPSHFFYKIGVKKVDVQYQKALVGMHEPHPLTRLIWSFRTRVSVVLSMLLQKYPRLKFECMRVMTPLMVDIKFNVSFFFISFVENHVYAYFIERNKVESVETRNAGNFGIRHRIASAVLEDNKTSEDLFYHASVAQFFQEVDPFWDSGHLVESV